MSSNSLCDSDCLHYKCNTLNVYINGTFMYSHIAPPRKINAGTRYSLVRQNDGTVRLLDDADLDLFRVNTEMYNDI